MSWRKAGLISVAAVLLAALPSAPQHVNFWDAQVKRNVARSLFEGRGLTIDSTPDDEQYIRTNSRGVTYSPYPLLSCLMYLPTVALEHWGIQADALPTLIMLAATAWLLAAWAARMGASPFAACFAVLLTCLCTPLWPMASYCYDTLISAVGLAAILLVAAGPATMRSWFWLGVTLGGALLVREDASLLAVPAAVALLLAHRRDLRALVRGALAAAAGGLPGVAITLAYRAWRYGPQSGLTNLKFFADWFSAQHWLGMAGLAVSPAKGIFWYCLPLLLTVILAPKMLAQFRKPLLICASYALCAVLFFGRLTFWHGDWSWGPRYVAGIYVSVIILGVWLGQRAEKSPRALLVAVGVLAFTLLLQLPILVADPVNAYLAQVVRPLAQAGRLVTTPYLRAPLPEDHKLLYFSISRSPLVIAFVHVFHLLRWFSLDREIQAAFLQVISAPFACLAALAYVYSRRDQADGTRASMAAEPNTPCE